VRNYSSKKDIAPLNETEKEYISKQSEINSSQSDVNGDQSLIREKIVHNPSEIHSNYPIENGTLTHVDGDGKASMVDVGDKIDTVRTAVAFGTIVLGKEAFNKVVQNQIKKGDVLSVSQLAGIFGAKQTSNLIPLCHPLLLNKIEVRLRLDQTPNSYSVQAEAEVTCSGKTGVEMEALTAVSISLLTVYDMCKAVSKDMIISNIRLISKTGGKSGYKSLV